MEIRPHSLPSPLPVLRADQRLTTLSLMEPSPPLQGETEEVRPLLYLHIFLGLAVAGYLRGGI